MRIQAVAGRAGRKGRALHIALTRLKTLKGAHLDRCIVATANEETLIAAINFVIVHKKTRSQHRTATHREVGKQRVSGEAPPDVFAGPMARNDNNS
jgi:hypothetical protein